MTQSNASSHIAAMAERLRARYGPAAPLLRFCENLPRGPHLERERRLPLDDQLRLISEVADGLTPLHDLSLHACFPAAATADAMQRLTSCGVASASGTTGLGRAMQDRGGLGQSQYLIDLADPVCFAHFTALADAQRALHVLRRVMLAVVDTPGVGSVPGVLDAQPVPGVASIRHFWLRISSGGAADAAAGHFNTNGNAVADPAEACWHVDNPRAPTCHATSRLLLKVYADGRASGRQPPAPAPAARPPPESPPPARENVHVLQVRAGALDLAAEVPVAAGDGVLMSDVARGSSRAATMPFACVEHRGRCPAGQWQVRVCAIAAPPKPRRGGDLSLSRRAACRLLGSALLIRTD